MQAEDLCIPSLGESNISSPIEELFADFYCKSAFVSDDARIIFDPCETHLDPSKPIPSLELAGPRHKIYFDPKQTRAAIVTCGGLCPGLNDVIRGIVMELYYRYGVEDILGIRYGYHGLDKDAQESPIKLNPETVSGIHRKGGSILGMSRGRPAISTMVDYLESEKINVLFIIGGDGTMRGALDIAQEVEKRGSKISLVGVPKTIDNDILYLDRSFGFQTAVAKASEAILSAHTEAKGAVNGIGLVKLMGRHSGFIACQATLGMPEANFVLIPEVPVKLSGEDGFLAALEKRILKKSHAVVVIAEGAAQEHFQDEALREKDASGNLKLVDVGACLKALISSYFATKQIPFSLKYIDPSYMIRSVPAIPGDSYYCWRLAQNAVHGAMSGKTKMVVGLRHNEFVHLPMTLIASGRRHVDSQGSLWMSVLEATGQPTQFLEKICSLD